MAGQAQDGVGDCGTANGNADPWSSETLKYVNKKLFYLYKVRRRASTCPAVPHRNICQPLVVVSTCRAPLFANHSLLKAFCTFRPETKQTLHIPPPFPGHHKSRRSLERYRSATKRTSKRNVGNLDVSVSEAPLRDGREVNGPTTRGREIEQDVDPNHGGKRIKSQVVAGCSLTGHRFCP